MAFPPLFNPAPIDVVVNGYAGNDYLYATASPLFGGVVKMYGFDGHDLLMASQWTDLMYGGSGTDTVSYQWSDQGVFASLHDGRGYSGYAAGDVYSSIENLTGSAHADRLVGDAGGNVLRGGGGDDVLIGGAGADWLYGDAGIDTASYETAPTGVFASLTSGMTNTSGAVDHATGDRYFDIENLTGSAYRDMLIGNGGGNTLKGGGDRDTLSGMDGDDVLEGGGDADLLDGGAGSDTASYANADWGVVASLLAPADNTGDAWGDTYVNIENLAGSRYNDTLVGNAGRNVLNGGDRADRIEGGAGDDILIGGEGIDVLVGGLGADVLYGGDPASPGGDDTFKFTSVLDSLVGARDTIRDYRHGLDTIDLSAIDANVGATGNQAFAVVGQSPPPPMEDPFSCAMASAFGVYNPDALAGQVWFNQDVLYGDVNGDHTADFAIGIVGLGAGIPWSDLVL